MIIELHIQNVALIDEVRVNFTSGLNVLTGETGAGKSIVVDAIGFLLGNRPGKDFVRSGADFAQVDGVLEFNQTELSDEFTNLGIELNDGQIFLYRSIQKGKSVCKINGKTVPVGMLRDVASLLVDLHGQHEHQSLLVQDKQLILLDNFCGQEVNELKEALSDKLGSYKSADKAYKKLTGVGNEKKELAELWQVQLEEINKHLITPEEEIILRNKVTKLRESEKLHSSVFHVYEVLSGNVLGSMPVLVSLGLAQQRIRELEELDPEVAPLRERLDSAQIEVEDISFDIRKMLDRIDAAPHELKKLEKQLYDLNALQRKYGGTIESLSKKQADLTKNLDEILNSSDEINRLNKVRKELSKEITNICNKLSLSREKAAKKISDDVTLILQDLGMKNAAFDISVTRKVRFSPQGNDEIEFMISPNTGEPAKPLRRIASGGEMSRVMLAIKTVMADADRVSTVIFDEVDTGISGRTAQQVAEKLMTISRRRQILCITHLPQIAAMADTHFLIEKTAVENRTITNVDVMSREKIISELARLTGGAQITISTLASVEEMKTQADNLKEARVDF